MRYAVIGFDLDGTLLDSAGAIAAAANAALAEAGLPPRQPEQIVRLIGAGARELLRRLLAEMLVEQSLRAAQLPFETMLERFEQHYAASAGSSPLYPGCRETLLRLRAAGVRLACVTNKEARFATRELEATRIAPCFDLIVGGDSLAVKKPHPAVLAHVLGRLGAQPERAAHVGDSRIDVESARNAQVAAWAVPWGYNAGVPIESAAPDRVFASLPQIADFVLRANAGAARSPNVRGIAARLDI